MITWFRKKMKVIMLAIVVIFVASMFYGYQSLSGGGSTTQNSNIIGKVNGREIDPARFQTIINKIAQTSGGRIGPQDIAFAENIALGQAIDFTLMLGEAEKKARISGREVDAALDNIMKQQKIPSKKYLDTLLKNMGLSIDKFRNLVKEDMLVQKFSTNMQEEIKVTSKDLMEIRASHILVSDESSAKKIQADLKAGEDFASLAKKYSIDKGTAVKGGDLGYFSTGAMVEPFEDAAFSLKPGEISGIIKTPFGYHIIKLTDSRMRQFPAGAPPEQIALKEKKDNAFKRWYSETRSKAKVEVLMPQLKGHALRFQGRPADAITEYKIAAAQNPSNYLIHIYLGDTYMSVGQKPLAIPEYEMAVRLNGVDPELYIILGRAYESAGEKGLASQQFSKASLIAGDNKALHEKLMKIFSGLKLSREAANEKSEIARINKKEAFEKSLK
ncbi:MAG: peptidylprolyl isomerase [Candidatus Margulisiibacteriota bacterium]